MCILQTVLFMSKNNTPKMYDFDHLKKCENGLNIYLHLEAKNFLARASINYRMKSNQQIVKKLKYM